MRHMMAAKNEILSIVAGTFTGPSDLVGADWTCTAGTWSDTGTDEFRFLRDGTPIAGWSTTAVYEITVTDLGSTITAEHRRNESDAVTATGSAVVLAAVDYEFIATASNSSGSVTIPTHEVGDIIVGFANRNSNTPPTFDATVGWETPLINAGGGGTSHIMFYKIATSTSETFGTHTNASRVGCWVYRPSRTIPNPIGGFDRSQYTLTDFGWTDISSGFRGRDSIVLATCIRSASEALPNRSDSTLSNTGGVSVRHGMVRTSSTVTSYAEETTTMSTSGNSGSAAVELQGWEHHDD